MYVKVITCEFILVPPKFYHIICLEKANKIYLLHLVELLNLKANINLFVCLSKRLENYLTMSFISLGEGGGGKKWTLLFLITKFLVILSRCLADFV